MWIWCYGMKAVQVSVCEIELLFLIDYQTVQLVTSSSSSQSSLQITSQANVGCLSGWEYSEACRIAGQLGPFWS